LWFSPFICYCVSTSFISRSVSLPILAVAFLLPLLAVAFLLPLLSVAFLLPLLAVAFLLPLSAVVFLLPLLAVAFLLLPALPEMAPGKDEDELDDEKSCHAHNEPRQVETHLQTLGTEGLLPLFGHHWAVRVEG
jgi:hypothetical protein